MRYLKSLIDGACLQPLHCVRASVWCARDARRDAISDACYPQSSPGLLALFNSPAGEILLALHYQKKRRL